MAKKGRSTKSPAARPGTPAGARSSSPRVRVAAGDAPPDPRRWIYAGIDLVFTIGYLWAFSDLLHNRFGWARALLYLLPACTTAMTIGTVYGRRAGWWLTVVPAIGMLVWTIGFMILLLVTASYLSGVYGAFGKAASSGVLLSTAFVIQFAATLPALQLKWALTRGGRRAYGLPALWRQPALTGAPVTAS